MDFHPRFTMGLTYDDNIYISSANQVDDFIWSFAPGVQLVAGDRESLAEYRLDNRDLLSLSPLSFITTTPAYWPGRLLTLDYSPVANFYTHESQNNGVDQHLTLNTLFPFAKLILGVRQGYSYVNQQVVEAGQRSRETRFNTAITSGYQISSRSSVQVNLRRDSFDYNSANLQGYAQYENDNWFGYQFSERLNLGGGVTLGYVPVEDDTEQTYQQLLARALYQLAEKVSLDLFTGVEFRQFSTDVSGEIQPVFSLTGTYRWRPTTSFSLNAHRRSQPSVQSGYNYNITGFSASASQRFLTRYTVTVTGGYDFFEYYTVSSIPQSVAERNNNDYWYARVAFEVRFNPFLRASAFYRYAQKNYTSDRSGFTDNQVGLSATYSF